jgi:acyl carrier protein
MEIPAKLTKYILENRIDSSGKTTLEPTEPLGLDSLSIIRLVSYLEEEFSISVADEDLVPENFQTLNQINELIERKNATST